MAVGSLTTIHITNTAINFRLLAMVLENGMRHGSREERSSLVIHVLVTNCAKYRGENSPPQELRPGTKDYLPRTETVLVSSI